MSGFIEHRLERLGESYFEYDHPTGVKLYVWQRPKSTGAYAVFGTKCGSVDDNFIPCGASEAVTVPAGIAHFLEHKLFENEDCGAFERYAKTGASGNAYTSFDRTCYLFSCTENFEQSFEILLDFVRKPYFTPETVQKELGIIGQEISMYDDDPNNQSFYQMLENMYVNDHVRLNIAGTAESISHITADMLYDCYNAFYHPANMFIAVAGNVEPERVLAVADRMLEPSGTGNPERLVPEEPHEVGCSYAEKHMDVASPLFALGFKDCPPEKCSMKDEILAGIVTQSIFGRCTSFYDDMQNDGLINESFDSGYLRVRSASMFLLEGESREPRTVADRCVAELRRTIAEGIDAELFECARRDAYGTLVYVLDSNNGICSQFTDMYMNGDTIDDMFEYIEGLTLEDANAFLRARLEPDNHTLSVILPTENNTEE